ncbi:YitT family protein [Heliophilum fasciatum]|uniref:Uncharacterized membrane-anchored protein YitT (DUF2179 family) n=1 Tax=Heliophilum fasciatum TaxID=35700 RepID=A0A4R2RFE7_9FIRM|nr:YitT family protein [Heliophilum fasciatum]TCP61029.1 uncharacterized membrane-anchored protein YitT (DUF2179 family) [Heliophilum fasciatum]
MVIKEHKKTPPIQLLKRAFFLSFGAILVAIGLEMFLVPNQIIDGGVVGVSIILSHLFNLPLGIFILILNLPFLVLGYRQIGKTFTISTLYSVTWLAVAVQFVHGSPLITEDLLLSSVFGGMTLGIGVGVILRSSGSLDGTEILAIILTRKFAFSVGEIIMFFNIFILGSAGFVFGWDKAMYSLITYFIAYKTIDIVLEGLNESKSVTIISSNPAEIAEAIIARLGRGVTYLYGKGGFTGEDKEILYCVVTRLELAKLRQIVLDIDPQAFIAVEHVAEVMGGRFAKKAIHN